MRVFPGCPGVMIEMAKRAVDTGKAFDPGKMGDGGIRRNPLSPYPAPAPPSLEDVPRILHELSVHQVELELQNEELRRAEAERETALARYVELYDSAPVGYCTLAGGVISEANLAAASLLGMDRRALIGQPMTRFIRDADQDAYDLFGKRLSGTDAAQQCELRMVKPDGTATWVHLAAAKRRGPPPRTGPDAGQAEVSRVVLSDISERKRAEEEQARLEGLLLQTQKLKALGTLAGGMAHDFNNLLATIMGNANLTAMEVEPGGKVASYMRAIEQAALTAAKLTRQLLAYSGQGQYYQSEVDLNPVLRESLRFLADSALLSADVQLVLSDRLPFVQGDPTQISEVMVNLLTNALEALEPAKGGRLIVRTRAEHLDRAAIDASSWALPLAPGHFATFEVADEGAGMTPETMTRVFEPFFSTKFTGRGLGLAEVIGVVRNHGGGLCVRSEPGQGSSFKVFLPAMRTPRSIRPQETAPLWRGKGRILVLDDEEAERNKVRRMAEELGFTVIEATGAMEAVEIFRLRHGDLALVLLDLSLPMKGGRVAFSRIHEIDSSIPVLLGSPFDAKEEDLFLDTPAGSLRKPYRQAEFRGVLQRTLA